MARALDWRKKKTVIMEYSQPNIAKAMQVGHMRNTIIGAALGNILEHVPVIGCAVELSWRLGDAVRETYRRIQNVGR